jgi:AbrB family looped-hinge helix DNA binding protein
MVLNTSGAHNVRCDLPGGIWTADVVTVSSKGQVVIPSKIRVEMAIKKQDKFLIVHDRDTILLKRIHEEKLKKRMKALLAKFRSETRAHKIPEKDVDEVIRKIRKQNA